MSWIRESRQWDGYIWILGVPSLHLDSLAILILWGHECNTANREFVLEKSNRKNARLKSGNWLNGLLGPRNWLLSVEKLTKINRVFHSRLSITKGTWNSTRCGVIMDLMTSFQPSSKGFPLFPFELYSVLFYSVSLCVIVLHCAFLQLFIQRF